MQNTNYLIKRKDRNYFSYQSKFNIPVSLQNHFGRKSFKISLKSGNYNACRGLSNRLHKLLKVLFQEIEMGKKKLTFEEVKSILKIEVDKSVLHIQHIETGTGTTESQVLQSLQHITKEESQFKRTLEDERKKIEDKVDREMSKILQSNGFEVDKKSLEFKTLRKRVIELKLLRFSHKKDFVSGKQTDLNKFLEECDSKFRLGISNMDKKNAFARNTHLQPVIENYAPESIQPYQVEVNEKVETILISKLIEEYIDTVERQKDLREKTIIEYRNTLDLMVQIIGDSPINQLSQKHGRLLSTSLEKLPPRRKTDSRYKDKSVKQILKMDIDNPMDTRTVNKLIQRCSTWLNWVIRKGYYEDGNIFHGKSIPSNTRKDKPTRELFSNVQLKLIFGKNYLNSTLNSTSPCKFVFYWVGIFGLFHGLRLQEILQLHMKDIYPLNKVWVIDINEDTKDKKLKTRNSKRIIPLHQTLIDLGFLDYYNILEKKGKERLFHELSLGRDGYTKNPSRFFNDYLRKLDIKSATKKYDFHSLRHTCNNSLIQKDVIEEHRNDYLGWEQTGMSKKVYGKPFEPSILKKRCSNVISFPINWKDLKVDWKLIIG
ncbi:MAG: site-specific integrase [SAR324 cluster bacterium]|nr:site-specific integrase [SAR324 cluster bacterium]